MGTRMILDDLILHTRCNQHWQYSGMDSLEYCHDKKHFSQYPFAVDYQYNSRGFRDGEWPVDIEELRQAVWCIGDSFTVGLGQPLAHTWPQVLSQRLGRRTINVSMDGASNNWIARRIIDIINAVNPKNIVVMWSYLERRESAESSWKRFYSDVRDPSWPDCKHPDDISLLPQQIQSELKNLHQLDLHVFSNDEAMRFQDDLATDEENFLNWRHCIDQVSVHDNIIHSVIPKFASPRLDDQCWEYLIDHVNKYTDRVNRLDLARDGHHFDILTSRWVVDQILPQLI